MAYRVYDASAFYAGVPFASPEPGLTTSVIFEEIKHIKQNHGALDTLLDTDRLKIQDPLKSSIDGVMRAAKKTRDVQKLSKADISAIALARETGSNLNTDDFAVSNLAKNLRLQVSPIMTKGLEFHTVFISGLEEGLFPHENSLSETDGLEEERRLMYVAITRERRRLYLSFAPSRMLHGQTRYNVASRFLQEIPEALVRRVGSRHFAQAPSFASAVPAPLAPSTPVPVGGALPWRVGQNVVHPKFGAGVIVNAEGRGADARVQVNFSRGGLKWLALEYAKLSPA